MGSTAAQTLLGKEVLVTRDHGQLLASRHAPSAMATIHPSAILRAPTSEQRQTAMADFVSYLRLVAKILRED